MFLETRAEAEVDAAGRFEIGNLDMGRYFLYLFSGTHLLQTRVIEVDSDASPVTVEIELRRSGQDNTRRGGTASRPSLLP
jgi:hypothetical protein